MKCFVILGLCAALFPTLLQARITVRAELVSDTYLQYESIRFQVKVINESGSLLTFGGASPNSRLHLKVTDTEGDLIPRTGRPFFNESWTVAPGQTAMRTFSLPRLFKIQEVGSYRLDTIVRFPDDTALKDKTRLFSVVSGIQVAEQKVKAKDRTFTLLSVNRNRREEILMRISNHEETKVMGTYFLGPYLKFYTPTFQVGRNDQVAVLHHASPTEIVFSLFKTNGEPVRKRTLPTTAADPVRLVEDEELGFVVRGVETTSMEDEEE